MGGSNSIDWADAFSRLHPVLLHLPIGLFVVLAWFQLWDRFRRSDGEQHTGRTAVVWLLVLSTPVTAASGWLLHEGAGYPDPVEWHEYLGISLAFLSLLIGLAHLRGWRMYGWLVWLAFLLVFPTAHFGGTLTHGENFLLNPWSGGPAAESQLDGSGALAAGAADGRASSDGVPEVNAPEAVEFADILPILDQYCTRCHGERKQRGDLALHTLESVLTGGDSGPAAVLGSASESLLLKRVLFPIEHEDHMPPPKKPQPDPRAVRWLQAWIQGEAALPGELEAYTQELAAEEDQDPEGSQPSGEFDSAEVTAAITSLRNRFGHVQAIATDSNLLWIDLNASDLTGIELSGLLAPLRDRVQDLSLSGKAIGAAELEFLGGMSALERLDLRRLSVEELDISPLSNSKSIRVLNLAGTALAPGGLETLAQMEGLERVYIWGTGMESSSASLLEQRPGLDVVGASAAPDEPVEVEPEVVFERPSEAETVAASTDSKLEPVNTVCPVSEQPVDPAFVILHEGRAIGFCCPNCPKTFWENPAEYLAKLGDG